MTRVAISISGAEEARERLLAQAAKLERPPRPLFELLAREWEASFRQHIRDQGVPEAFAPLAASTLRRRAKAGFGPTPILVRNGDLLQSLRALEVSDTALAVGTDHMSAALLQYGGETSPHSAIPNAPVPPRPFVLLTDQEVDDAFVMVEEFYLGDPFGDA